MRWPCRRCGSNPASCEDLSATSEQEDQLEANRKYWTSKIIITALFDISHAIVRKFGSLLDNLCSDISAQPAVSGLSAGNEHELHRNQNLIIIARDIEVHFPSIEELGLTCLLLLPTLTVGRVG